MSGESTEENGWNLGRDGKSGIRRMEGKRKKKLERHKLTGG